MPTQQNNKPTFQQLLLYRKSVKQQLYAKAIHAIGRVKLKHKFLSNEADKLFLEKLQQILNHNNPSQKMCNAMTHAILTYNIKLKLNQSNDILSKTSKIQKEINKLIFHAERRSNNYQNLLSIKNITPPNMNTMSNEYFNITVNFEQFNSNEPLIKTESNQ